MLPNLSAPEALASAAALATLAGIAWFTLSWYRHLAHEHDRTATEFTWCLMCKLLAGVLRRGHGRHRMKDLYDHQRTIRADWRELTRNS